ncbi:unnamed protein product [Ambrosiozyma monospora]|uniref:Unnamed protein product n=1 Tax=Ambrosiozyma monospora TaxID=43982 RepID=A0ACB5TVK9_AMBMO|nr:unnamed protein product [Ambrosiozyma monospora]
MPRKDFFSACDFQMLIINTKFMFDEKKVSIAFQHFVNTLLNMKPRKITAEYWGAPDGDGISKLLDRPTASMLARMKIDEARAVTINENMGVFPNLESVVIQSVKRDFNLVKIKTIL